MTRSARFHVETRGNTQVIDITELVAQRVREAGIRDGMVCVFVMGSTASVTTTEAEPGLMTHDLAAYFERVAPEDGFYKHEATWGDDNGHAHVRASVLGPSIVVPSFEGQLALGTYQQIVLIDFDTRGRRREIIVQIVGDGERGE